MSGCLLLGIGLLATQTAVSAQTIITPTPNSEGVILVEVKPNDSLWVIAASAGISLEELLQLNDLTEDAVVQPGDLLIIGYGQAEPSPTPTVPTATPSPTLPPPPTATAVPPLATGLCLVAFRDTDGNGEWHPGEPMKADVAFTIYNDQTVILNYITDGISEPACFENMVPGTYQITRSLEGGERVTTPGNRGIIIEPGLITHLEFGSTTNPQLAIQTTVESEPAAPIAATAVDSGEAETDLENGRLSYQPLFLVIIGISLLLIGIIFFIIMRLRIRE